MTTKNVIIKQDGKLYAKKGKKLKVAVRLFCGECMGMSRMNPVVEYPTEDVKACTDKMCPLWEWRLGKNPYPSQKKIEHGRRLGKYKATL